MLSSLRQAAGNEKSEDRWALPIRWWLRTHTGLKVTVRHVLPGASQETCGQIDFFRLWQILPQSGPPSRASPLWPQRLTSCRVHTAPADSQLVCQQISTGSRGLDGCCGPALLSSCCLKKKMRVTTLLLSDVLPSKRKKCPQIENRLKEEWMGKRERGGVEGKGKCECSFRSLFETQEQ